MRIKIISGLALFCLTLQACKHEIPNPIEPDPSGQISCHPDTVYFQQQILPLLSASCAFSGCHDAASAEDGVILDNYWNIMQTADVNPGDPEGSDLYEVLVEDYDDDDRMPPYPDYEPLSPAQIALIYNWIAQGALNNSCEDCVTENITYETVIGSLIQNRCQSCHSGASPDGGILLTNYAQVSNVAINGPMEEAITHTGSAAPMPYNSPQLPQCEVDQIVTWINNGAPLN
jgi:hypothetical protein